jgi:cellulose synthase/poly-beta-1,6-N-acetylglucosamine synthase-like glycosyltransferase
MAYNEAANIGRLLEGLLNQKTEKVAIDRIIVVASGCTDGTEDIVCEVAEKDSRVELLVQEKREGKASAVNQFMRNIDHKIVVMQSADTVPVEGTIEALVSPFEDPNVGMVGGTSPAHKFR